MPEVTYTQMKQRAREIYEATNPDVPWDDLPYPDRNPWIEAAKEDLGITPQG